MNDFRYAIRQLASQPGFTAVAVLTLALGIGASTAMFTLVNSVLLRPLAYADPDRLVMVWERSPNDPERDNFVSPANLSAWREQARSFEALAAMMDRPRNLTGGGEPEELTARLSSANYFDVLGVGAAYGRTYTAADEGENVAVLGHRLWQRRYGGDPGIIGRAITVNGEPLTVVGVMPPDFNAVGTESPELWRPIELSPEARGRWVRVVGRLRPGVSAEQARAEMRAIAERLAIEFPAFNAKWSADVVPLHEQETGDVRPALLILFGAVGLLLLIACANLANLLLGRAAARRKEMAVRLSLGGTRWRLVRQTFTEALVLAVLAGGVGLLLATWGLDLLVRLLPSELALPRLHEVGPDARVVAFAVGVALMTAALFGGAPALAGSAIDLGAALREAMRGSTGGHNRLRRALVVTEVALAVVLLAGAGLLARSLRNLLDTETGMRTEHVLTMRVSLMDKYYDEDDENMRRFVRDLLPRLEALPGARAVGAIGSVPLSGSKWSAGYTVVGRPAPPPGEEPGADIRVVAGDYHRAMSIPLLRGRTFDARDHQQAPRAFVINEALAEEQFPGADPLGERLSTPWWGETLEGEVVGVVGNVRESGLNREPAPAIYWTYLQVPWWHLLNVVIRTAGDPTALAGAAAAAVREVDPNQPVAEIRTMEQVVRNTVARPRFNLMLLGGFAAASLLLAALGLFGVVSYLVAQRRQEIGVRVALGARTPDVLRLIVGEGVRLTLIGLLIGLGAAAALTRLMASLLHGVTPTDPVTLGGVSLLLIGVTLAASWLPARRAARVDPMEALRYE
jgi:putative ABC transport system permease protein